MSTTQFRGNVYLRILPVKVTAGRNTVTTLALIDDGSQTTLCSSSLLTRLNATTRLSEINIVTIMGQSNKIKSSTTSLKVSSIKGESTIELKDVKSLPKLPIGTDAAAHLDAQHNWEHLSDIVTDIKQQCIDNRIKDDHPVELLIGDNTPEAFWIQEERRGGPRQPFAHKTQLGWTIQGPSSSKANCQASVNFVHESVDLQLQRLWTTDFPERQHDDEQLPSIEDKEAIRLVQDSTEKHDNRYIIGMPWKTKKESIPNNKVVAERRLEGLRRKLSSDPDLKTKYNNAIDDYLNEGYAEILRDETPNRKTGVWYIPHHAVVNPNKEKINCFRLRFIIQGKKPERPSLPRTRSTKLIGLNAAPFSTSPSRDSGRHQSHV